MCACIYVYIYNDSSLVFCIHEIFKMYAGLADTLVCAFFRHRLSMIHLNVKFTQNCEL